MLSGSTALDVTVVPIALETSSCMKEFSLDLAIACGCVSARFSWRSPCEQGVNYLLNPFVQRWVFWPLYCSTIGPLFWLVVLFVRFLMVSQEFPS